MTNEIEIEIETKKFVVTFIFSFKSKSFFIIFVEEVTRRNIYRFVYIKTLIIVYPVREYYC